MGRLSPGSRMLHPDCLLYSGDVPTGMSPPALCMLGKGSAIELHWQSYPGSSGHQLFDSVSCLCGPSVGCGHAVIPI